MKPVGIGINTATGETFNIPRKQWTCCPACAQVLTLKLMDRVALFFYGSLFTGKHRDNSKDTPLYFFTLTLRDDQHLPLYMKRFYNSLRHDYPQLRGFWLKEFQRRGVRHIHGIMNVGLSKKELKKRWRQATKGNGYQVDISRMNDGIKNAAGYMMKYMTKQLEAEHAFMLEGKAQFDQGERRYGFWKPKGEKVPRAPAPVRDPDVEIRVELGAHYNPESKHWPEWYDKQQQAYGTPFLSYMSWATLSDIKKGQVARAIQELNFESPSYYPIFTGVKLYQVADERPPERGPRKAHRQ